MSYHDPELHRIWTGRTRTRSPRVTLTVVLVGKHHHHLSIKEDETARTRTIPRTGIEIVSVSGIYAKLRMSERKALDLNLV